MTDYVLSLWARSDQPDDGCEPIRLAQVGGDVIATHPEGVSQAPFMHEGNAMDPADALTQVGLMDNALLRFVGDELWRRATLGEIGSALRQRLAQARVYLDLRSDVLLKYPWEIMRFQDEFLFAQQQTTWSLRQGQSGAGIFRGTPPDHSHPLRLMVLVGNEPSDTNIKADDELLAIERHAHARNADILLEVLYRPLPSDIEDELKKFNPHVLHFIGHGEVLANGNPAIRIWSKDAGINERWDAERITGVFRQAPPRLVLLNACETAAAAPLPSYSLFDAFFRAGCIAVVAMTGKIRGDASVEFTGDFYERLCAGDAVDRATAHARLFVKSLATAPDPANAAALRSNWPLARLAVGGDANEAVQLKSPADNIMRWVGEDFVDRWKQRRESWATITNRYKLAVLFGESESGKTELLRAISDLMARSGTRVIYVDVSGPPTGDWRDLLQRIADVAREDGIDATELQAAIASGNHSNTVIKAYRAALEGCAAGDQVLVVIDGLGKWQRSLIEDTVLPELCAPYLTEKNTVVRMLITLVDRPERNIWGAVPADWEPIEVGTFDDLEWSRAIHQFAYCWRSKVSKEKLTVFEEQVAQFKKHSFFGARGLNALRIVAKAMR